MQSQDFALGGLPPAPCEWPKPHLPKSLHLLVTGEKERADCFLSEGRSCLMDSVCSLSCAALRLPLTHRDPWPRT